MESDKIRINVIEDLKIKNIPKIKNILVKTEAPLRVGLCVQDMGTFAPGVAGGGGVGITLDNYTKCTARVNSGKDNIIKSSRKTLINHAIAVFKAHFEEFPEVSFDITVESSLKDQKHIGLGTTSSCAMSVLTCLNEIAGKPFTMIQLRKMWILNYCEDDETGKLTLGYETGMTGAGAVKGGVFIIETNAIDFSSFALTDPKTKVFICLPKLKKGESVLNTVADMNDEQKLLEEGGKDDSTGHNQTKKDLFKKVKTSLVAQNLAEFGATMWQTQGFGSKKVEIQKQGRGIFPFMEDCHKAGFELVAMSSIGPAVCLVSNTKTQQELQLHLQKHQFELVFETKINNTGCKISFANPDEKE